MKEKETLLYIAFKSIIELKERSLSLRSKVLGIKNDISSSLNQIIIKRLEVYISILESEDNTIARLLVDNYRYSDINIWSRYYLQG